MFNVYPKSRGSRAVRKREIRKEISGQQYGSQDASRAMDLIQSGKDIDLGVADLNPMPMSPKGGRCKPPLS